MRNIETEKNGLQIFAGQVLCLNAISWGDSSVFSTSIDENMCIYKRSSAAHYQQKPQENQCQGPTGAEQEASVGVTGYSWCKDELSGRLSDK